MEDQQNIESELSDFDTKNGLGDYTLMSPKNKIYTDIKSKLMYLNSNPKAYNVDKFLECMSEENSVFLFYFIGINEEGHYKSELCSVYDKKLIEATVLQHHWAGRATRGVAQFKGDALSKILNDESTDGSDMKSVQIIVRLSWTTFSKDKISHKRDEDITSFM